MTNLDWSKTEIFLLVIVIVISIMLILEIVIAFIAGNFVAKITKPIDDATKFVKDVVNSIPQDTRDDLRSLGLELSKDAVELANAAGVYLKDNKTSFKALLNESTVAGVNAIKNLPNLPTNIAGVQKLTGLSAASKMFA
jgi:hypothetical protein